MLPPLTGKLRPKPENIGPMALRSKEPAPEERGDVKFLHVGLLAAAGAAGGQQRQRAGGCEGAMQSLLAGRLPFRIVVMKVVDMISIGLTPSNRIMSILPSSAGADGGLSW